MSEEATHDPAEVPDPDAVIAEALAHGGTAEVQHETTTTSVSSPGAEEPAKGLLSSEQSDEVVEDELVEPGQTVLIEELKDPDELKAEAQADAASQVGEPVQPPPLADRVRKVDVPPETSEVDSPQGVLFDQDVVIGNAAPSAELEAIDEEEVKPKFSLFGGLFKRGNVVTAPSSEPDLEARNVYRPWVDRADREDQPGDVRDTTVVIEMPLADRPPVEQILYPPTPVPSIPDAPTIPSMSEEFDRAGFDADLDDFLADTQAGAASLAELFNRTHIQEASS